MRKTLKCLTSVMLVSRHCRAVVASLALLITISCSGPPATAAPIVRGPGVQLSIPVGWVDAAPSAAAMPAGSAKSEYVVGVQSRLALDGFTPNFNVFVKGPHQVDWAAGDGLSEPTVGEIAGYNRRQISKVDGFEVTLLNDLRLAGEPATEFAFTRTVDRCSCMVRQTSITVAHGGMVYTGILTTADKSTKALAPILANLRASWRWSGQAVSASPVPAAATSSYAAIDVLLTLADLPDAFRPDEGWKPVPISGDASKVFKAGSPYRSLLTKAHVWPDEGHAETYRARRATPIPNVEIGELTIAADAKALLPESRMFAGVAQENGKSYEWFRIVWRDGVTVSEVASQSAPGAFSQADIARLALKQAAHTRFAAAPPAGASTSAGSVESPSAGHPLTLTGVVGQATHFPGIDVTVVSVDKNYGGSGSAPTGSHIVAVTIVYVNTGHQPFDYNQLNWTIVDQYETAHYPRERLVPAQLAAGASVQLMLTFAVENTATMLAISARVGPNELRVPIS